jgi:hypothetical protein
MSDSTPVSPGNEPANGQFERFEVVLESPAAESADERDGRTARVSALDLDRLPDRDNVRLLVDAEQLDRLREAGLQVSVQRSVPVRPLDPALVATEDDVMDWLTARLGPTPGAAPAPDGPHSGPTAASPEPSDEER